MSQPVWLAAQCARPGLHGQAKEDTWPARNAPVQEPGRGEAGDAAADHRYAAAFDLAGHS